MSDPVRLLQGRDATSATAGLLRALKPPTSAPPGVKTALGQQLAGMVAQGALPAAAVGGAWLKVTLAAVVVAASGAAVWKLASGSAPAPAPVAVLTAPSLAPAPTPTASVAPATPEPAASAAEPARAAAPRAPEPRDRLAEEEALLEQARSQLAASPARALGLLRQHQARHPGGQLAAERMFLSVDCLRRLGRRAEAQREVDALVARYPSSAYARRAPLLLSSPSR